MFGFLRFCTVGCSVLYGCVRFCTAACSVLYGWMFGFVRLCTVLYGWMFGFVRLHVRFCTVGCSVLYGFVRLDVRFCTAACSVLYGFVRFCTVVYGFVRLDVRFCTAVCGYGVLFCTVAGVQHSILCPRYQPLDNNVPNTLRNQRKDLSRSPHKACVDFFLRCSFNFFCGANFLKKMLNRTKPYKTVRPTLFYKRTPEQKPYKTVRPKKPLPATQHQQILQRHLAVG